jgi:hypothetical protein
MVSHALPPSVRLQVSDNPGITAEAENQTAIANNSAMDKAINVRSLFRGIESIYNSVLWDWGGCIQPFYLDSLSHPILPVEHVF